MRLLIFRSRNLRPQTRLNTHSIEELMSQFVTSKLGCFAQETFGGNCTEFDTIIMFLKQ